MNYYKNQNGTVVALPGKPGPGFTKVTKSEFEKLQTASHKLVSDSMEKSPRRVGFAIIPPPPPFAPPSSEASEDVP